ncbi:hypothetical protein COHA_008124 [Chlorella ohadii]|uniref:Uncharacterized protein n=1 Tax=Chlorella ohadii TaxID=2649997 RepID=A0AAD5H2R3_9CHLO|nr:hypothetical protein COHA_008124 [Chlorella ohadii]
MSLRETREGGWTFDLFQDAFADPATCIISYCLPCVTYGQTAEAVHGPSESCVQHGLKFYLYSCLCLCGLVAGPTRHSIRQAYKLPAQPTGLGNEDANEIRASQTSAAADAAIDRRQQQQLMCIHVALSMAEGIVWQARKLSAPLDPRPFAEMTKEAAPAAPAVPTSTPASAP